MTDQTDRELLELAARAFISAGYKSGQFSSPDDAVACLCKGGKVWHPLSDDGDALRLAVKLGIDIEFCHSSACVTTINPWTRAEFVEHPTTDALADARRAIVRAAAAIAQNGATK